MEIMFLHVFRLSPPNAESKTGSRNMLMKSLMRKRMKMHCRARKAAEEGCSLS